MSERVARAVEYMRGAYSCSQSVMCAFCEEAGITHDEAKKIAAPYAGGAKIKCGAVCAGDLILTAKYGEAESEALRAEFERKFLDRVGAINCREIRSRRLIPCVGCVEESAKILDGMLRTH